jgi:hypothetical protein
MKHVITLCRAPSADIEILQEVSAYCPLLLKTACLLKSMTILRNAMPIWKELELGYLRISEEVNEISHSNFSP